jgi:hypothetical protein
MRAKVVALHAERTHVNPVHVKRGHPVSRRNPKFIWQQRFLTEASTHTRSVITVGMFLANHWNGGDDLVYASEGFIASGTGLNERSVRRALTTLREEGWVFRVSRGGRRGDGTTYPSYWRPTFPISTGQTGILNRTRRVSQPDTGVRQVDPEVDPYEVDPYASPWEIPVEGGRDGADARVDSGHPSGALRAQDVPEQPALRAEDVTDPWATPAPGEELPEMSPAMKNQWANCPAYDSWVPGRIPCPHDCAEGSTCVASMARWQQEMDS